MEETFVLFRGIKNDLKGRFLCYKQRLDWWLQCSYIVRGAAGTKYRWKFDCGTNPCIEAYLSTLTRSFVVALSFFYPDKGIVEEFGVSSERNPEQTALQPSWRFGNGMFALVLSFGLLLTALKSRKARSSRYGTVTVSISNYYHKGLDAAVTSVSGATYGSCVNAVSYVPANDVPRGFRGVFSVRTSGLLVHILIGLSSRKWCGTLYSGSICPATMIAVLYYFDHSVASQLAQQKELNLKKPISYHYDLLLLGFLVILCGLTGIPQSNVTERAERITIRLASSSGYIDAPVDETLFDVEKEIDELLPVEIHLFFGAIRFHGHRKVAWKSILGENTVAFHCSNSEIKGVAGVSCNLRRDHTFQNNSRFYCVQTAYLLERQATATISMIETLDKSGQEAVEKSYTVSHNAYSPPRNNEPRGMAEKGLELKQTPSPGHPNMPLPSTCLHQNRNCI
ncbi:hypothetical protein F3Y22_tig00112382pilonHSYRG00139 [Hibiscus syriacus]|uniref:Bicarbonate transporter-like transmembrane domain-containing protein n=1 Tax=Hibiscus syriacus TaxID=106335 RepID=A0A6A2XL18_HIBSY|nr:hypothetical protein F3Y22_tig00112382pilonHSYRG00139 [Hibiscus syriacus]